MPYLPAEHLDAALDDAIGCGNKEVVKIILTSPAVSIDGDSSQGTTPLILAAKGGNYSILEMLLSRGADPKKVTSHNSGPLHALFGQTWNHQAKHPKRLSDCLRILVEAGADVNAVDN